MSGGKTSNYPLFLIDFESSSLILSEKLVMNGKITYSYGFKSLFGDIR